MIHKCTTTVTAPRDRLLTRAIFAGAIALTTSAVGFPAIAKADWDIEKYDNCLADSAEHGEPDFAGCCLDSGGVWKIDEQKCVAPAANSGVNQGGSTQPPVAPSRAPGIGPRPLPGGTAP